MIIKKKFQGTVPDNKILNMKSDSKTDTYSCNQVNNMLNSLINYSTEEQVIGTWINGKPLYRKTLLFDNNGGTGDVQHYSLQTYGINNVDEIFLAHPSYYGYNGCSYPFNYFDGNQFMADVDKTTLHVCLQYEPISNSPFVITLEYTKTTD